MKTDVRNIVVLGSTGSIGRSALEVIESHSGRFSVRALAAHSNYELLAEQYRRIGQLHGSRPEYLCMVDQSAAEKLRDLLAGEKVTILSGEDDLVKLAGLDSISLVLNAVVGAAGLRVSLETIRQGKNLALANKESMVAGGPLFKPLLEKSSGKILPIDSEHSAIWQALRSGNRQEVRKIILTSSGGPFRDWPAERFDEITIDDALEHPTWKMGPKVTIDSATLANKGLEVMEAVYLFSISPDQIEVVVHPQSVIHSMVEYVDSSVIAQLSLPDMRLPISYALFYPDRVKSEFGRIDWSNLTQLTFEQPDRERFPALELAYQAVRQGGTAPAIYNAANEVAVAAFLDGSVRFVEIADIIKNSLDSIETVLNPDLESILEADSRARQFARGAMEKVV